MIIWGLQVWNSILAGAALGQRFPPKQTLSSVIRGEGVAPGRQKQRRSERDRDRSEEGSQRKKEQSGSVERTLETLM